MVMQNIRNRQKKQSFLAWMDDLQANVDIPETLIYAFLHYLQNQQKIDYMMIDDVVKNNSCQWMLSTRKAFVDFIENMDE